MWALHKCAGECWAVGVAGPCGEDVAGMPRLSFQKGKFLGRKESGGYFTGLRLSSCGVSGPAELQAQASAKQRCVWRGLVLLPALHEAAAELGGGSLKVAAWNEWGGKTSICGESEQATERP